MSLSDLSPEERQRKREAFPIRFMMSPPKAMYDIGVGPKTEWDVYRLAFPDMRTFGVEANPGMVKDILARGWSGPLLNAAITTKTEKLKLSLYRADGLDASILDIPGRSVADTVEVDPMTLDAADVIFEEQEDILLWMDIEGAELDALISGPNLMGSGRVRWINLEVRPTAPWVGGCTDVEVEAHLASLGYKKVAEYNHNKRSPHYDVLYFHVDERVNPKPTPNHVPQK
jgi:FkbM family methyltransferase